MATKRATYHHNNLSNALVTAAGKLIATHGVAGFSLREAAREIGVDPAAVYRHFRDKDALLDELARRGFVRLAERMESAIARRTSPTGRLRALGAEYIEFAFDEPALFRTMFASPGVDAREPRRRGDYARGPYEILVTCTTEWKRRNVETTARVLWSSLHGIAMLAIDGALPLDRSAAHQLATAALDLLLAA